MRRVFDRAVAGREAARLLADLRQGHGSVLEYSIQFRTLAAECRWNEEAQWDRFLHGLADRIQREIYMLDLPTSLNGLMELALRVDARLSRMGRFQHDPPVRGMETRRAEYLDTVSPPHDPEPMQVGMVVPLLREGGPLHSLMPIKRPSPVVTMRLLSGGISTEKTSSSPSSSTLLPVRLRWATYTHDTQALSDSGAEGNFMDLELAHHPHIPTTPLRYKITVNALNGQQLPSISQATEPITLITSGNHTETITFLLMNSPLAPIVLGHPWFTQHNPRVDWGHNSISMWNNTCHESCLVSACSSVPVSVFQEERVNLSNVPEEYQDLREVFSKSRAASLPPHRPYDCAIDLVPGTRSARQTSASEVAREWAFCQGGEMRFSCTVRPFFLGYIVSSEGVRMDPDKVKAVIDWPSPDSRKALQRFLGFANFYRRFIRNFSQLVAPLTALTSPRTTFRWSDTAEAVYAKLKSRFVSAPILVAPDPARQFVVEVDASEVGVGAVLSQRSATDDRIHPCAFFFSSFITCRT
uniref:Reverse transcriptase/retrotransposon-derived protein RNase H-like domain-containing protein n=1 Tax=Cyprinus carpio carpio TaxID=630221 RepID=A0A9J8BP49_CYPCA